MKVFWTRCLLLMLMLMLMLVGCADERENSNPFSDPGSNAMNSMANEGGGTSVEGEVTAAQTGGGESESKPDGEATTGDSGGTEADVVGPEEDGAAGSEASSDVAEEEEEEDSVTQAECEVVEDCPEADPCQTVTCDGESCVYMPMEEKTPCDDGDACTGDDVCISGTCAGFKVDCDDDNACTNDSCVNGCTHTPVDTPECTLLVEFISPVRGDLVYGDPEVTVSGKVISPGSPVDAVFLNGEELTLDNNNQFQVNTEATIGVNMLKLEASNEAGQQATSAISFAYGDGIHEMGTVGSVNRLVSATGAWLDEVNFNDGNPDLDDLSSVAVFVLENFDINSIIPHPLIAEGDGPGVGWCQWEVDIVTTGGKQITYDLEDVSVKPMDGGMMISGSLSNFEAWVEAEAGGFACPDGKGWFRADSVKIMVEADTEITSVGAVEITIQSSDVTISGTEVDIQEGAGAWVNWLVDWFEDDLENLVEEELSAFIPENVVPLIESALNEVAHVDESFTLPALPGGVPLPLTISVIAAGADFSPDGVEFALSAGIAVDPFLQDVSHNGSIARGTCGGGGAGVNPVVGPIPGEGGGIGSTGSCAGKCGEEVGLCWCDAVCVASGDCCNDACDACGHCADGNDGAGENGSAYGFDKESPIEVRIHEDMLNHILHAAWIGGYLNLDLAPIVFEEVISVLGATDMEMTVYPYMPPMVTSCTDDGELEVHVGAVLCDATFTFNGVPAAFRLYADIQTEIELTTVDNIEGVSEIGVMLKELESYQVDVLETEGLGSLGDLLVNAVLTDSLVQLLVADVLNNLIATYPVPTLDLNSLVPTIPAGTFMTGDFYEVDWNAGHFEAIGAIYNID